MCPTSTGAAAACTPCRSFFSLSRPLVLLLVVGPGVFDRDGISVHWWCSRAVCLFLWCVCLCVRALCMLACFIQAGSSAFLAPLASSPCSGVIPPLVRPSPDLMADAPAVRRRRVRGEDGEQHRAVRARVDDAETRLGFSGSGTATPRNSHPVC